MRLLKIVLSAALCIAVAWGIWAIRAHGFSARERPAAYEEFLATYARRLASEPDARSLRNPIEATPLAVAEGRDHFADH